MRYLAVQGCTRQPHDKGATRSLVYMHLWATIPMRSGGNDSQRAITRGMAEDNIPTVASMTHRYLFLLADQSHGGPQGRCVLSCREAIPARGVRRPSTVLSAGPRQRIWLDRLGILAVIAAPPACCRSRHPSCDARTEELMSKRQVLDLQPLRALLALDYRRRRSSSCCSPASGIHGLHL